MCALFQLLLDHYFFLSLLTCFRIGRDGLMLFARLATRGPPLLSVICIKTTPDYAILRCFLATGTLWPCGKWPIYCLRANCTTAITNAIHL